jgi:hypothetical protein
MQLSNHKGKARNMSGASNTLCHQCVRWCVLPAGLPHCWQAGHRHHCRLPSGADGWTRVCAVSDSSALHACVAWLMTQLVSAPCKYDRFLLGCQPGSAANIVDMQLVS